MSIPQIHTKKVGETVNISVDLAGLLDAGELFTGTPTIVELTTSDLTLNNKVVNTAELTINKRTVAIGEAVQFSVAAGVLLTKEYFIKITVSTTSSPSQTRVECLQLNIIGDCEK